MSAQEPAEKKPLVKMFLKLIITILLLVSSAYSQPDSLWGRTYGFDEFGAEHIGEVIQPEEGGFLLAGYYRRHEHRYDIYVVRTDEMGDTLWTRFYGGDDRDNGEDIIQIENGDFILACYTESYGLESGNGYIMQIDSDGEIVWDRTYQEALYLLKIISITDNRYALVGIANGSWDAIFMIIDEDGDVIFSETYGGDGGEFGRGVLQTEDGGYLLLIASNSFGNGGYDPYLVKLDAEYEIEWTNTYGGENDDGCFSIIPTLDGGYALAGYTESFSERGDDDYWFIKIDENGEEQWSQVYGEGLDDKCYNIVQLANGDFILAGSSDRVAPYHQCGLIRIDNNGGLIWEAYYWQRCYRCNSLILTDDGGYMLGGGTYIDDNFFLLKLGTDMLAWIQPPDSSFMENTVLAYPITYFLDYLITDVYRDSVLTFSFIDGEHISGEFTEDSLIITPVEDWFGLDSLLLTVAEADSETNCDTTWLWLTVTENTSTPIPDELQIPTAFFLSDASPNPFNSTTSIAYNLPAPEWITVKILDLSGREIATLVNGMSEVGNHHVHWNGLNTPSGVYVCRMEAGSFTKSIKLAIVR